MYPLSPPIGSRGGGWLLFTPPPPCLVLKTLEIPRVKKALCPPLNLSRRLGSSTQVCWASGTLEVVGIVYSLHLRLGLLKT